MHDVVVRVVTTAVRTVMMNWMMVFQRFMSLRNAIMLSFRFVFELF